LGYCTVPTTVANGGQLVDPLNPANAADPQREEPDVVEEFDDLGVDPVGTDFVLTSLRQALLVTATFEPATLTPSRPTDTGVA
jgi:hypothetical protein